MNIKEKIGNTLLFFDGAMGSVLQSRGLKTGELPETLNLTSPDIIYGVHLDYLSAGADIISANTFGAYKTKYNNVEEIISAGINIAKRAISENDFKDKYVALDMGSVGKLLKPLGDLTFDECYDIFKTSALAGEKAGANLVILETLSDTYEAKAAILAIRENTSLPIICTMTFDEKGTALTGADIITAATLLESLRVDALGINCGLGPVQTKFIFDKLIKYTSTPVLVQPNAGLPKIVDGITTYDITPDEFALHMSNFVKEGAWLVGGCCGTTPEHIRKTVDMCRNITPPPVTEKNITALSSYSKTVIIDKKPVIIGERINPTGKKKFKEALKENNMNYILNEAVTQADCGADVLDVNVGLPEIDETEMMVKAIELVQSAVDLPLQIDSSTPEVLEKALRIYNGKPLVNSVNGKQAVMDAVFPIVQKYGGVLVALALDEDGIPPTAEGRLEIANKIIKNAEKYGIKKKDLIIDTLTLTVSAQQSEAKETLRALSMVRDDLGMKTVLGVSNISFGLPNRSLVNTTFLALALHSGLSACIINPMSQPMIDTINAYNVLLDIDKNCVDYIEKYSVPADTPQPEHQKKDEPADLKTIVVKGLQNSSYDCTMKLLETTEPLKVIDEYIVPALDEVGDGYEKGKMFLPQLIMSAETAKSAFAAIKDHLDSLGVSSEKKGTIAMATVAGDIHDIGKNIVCALLENYGFEVIDLGKDVPVETIVNTVSEKSLKLLGLSALMTTTVVNMEKTIEEVRKTSPECKIMVGGAVLNEDYAKKIGADFYGKDALASVSYAQKIFS